MEPDLAHVTLPLSCKLPVSVGIGVPDLLPTCYAAGNWAKECAPIDIDETRGARPGWQRCPRPRSGGGQDSFGILYALDMDRSAAEPVDYPYSSTLSRCVDARLGHRGESPKIVIPAFVILVKNADEDAPLT